MKVQTAIKILNKKLSTHCNNYNNECIFLCQELVGISRNDIVMNVDISDRNFKVLNRAVNKRIKGVPLQIIIGESDFLNIRVLENKYTLTPRPETEFLVDYIIKNESHDKKVLDLCCGSGCIGIALNKNGFENVVLSDVSKRALKFAVKNAKLNGVNVDIKRSNMFDSISEKFDLIVSNPPYIETGDIKNLQTEVKRFDPKLALDGGSDGLDFYRIIGANADKFLNDHGILYLEIGLNQEKQVQKLLEKTFKNITIIKDLNKINRFIRAEKC